MVEECFLVWVNLVEECLKYFDVEVIKGFSKSVVEKNWKKYGWNEL